MACARPMRDRAQPVATHAVRGFTLVEVLVALAVMAVLALVSWRGLEAMAHSQAVHRDRDDTVLVLQTALAQWSADLDAATMFGTAPAIDWDGRVLRITRRSTDGSGLPAASVVAWTLRADAAGTRWLRWQSPPLATRGQWEQAWQLAGTWGQDGTRELEAAAVPLLPVTGWSLAYFRNNAWVAAMRAESLGPDVPLPDGVRLVLQLPPGTGLSGEITRDWVRPTWAGQRAG